jgi:hypothetical protein
MWLVRREQRVVDAGDGEAGRYLLNHRRSAWKKGFVANPVSFLLRRTH